MKELNGHEYVDLGLSVLWATKNIGASTEDESGDYFSWGEIMAKESYSWKEYKFGYPYLTKYVNTDYPWQLDFPADVDSLVFILMDW